MHFVTRSHKPCSRPCSWGAFRYWLGLRPLKTQLDKVSKMAPSHGCRLRVPWNCHPEHLHMGFPAWHPQGSCASWMAVGSPQNGRPQRTQWKLHNLLWSSLGNCRAWQKWPGLHLPVAGRGRDWLSKTRKLIKVVSILGENWREMRMLLRDSQKPVRKRAWERTGLPIHKQDEGHYNLRYLWKLAQLRIYWLHFQWAFHKLKILQLHD